MLVQRTFLVAMCALFTSVLELPHVSSYAVGQSKYGKVEKFPYQVMLIGKQLWRKRILCGGTLLDKRWVLTAGHCVTGVTHFDIYMGAKSLSDIMEPGRMILRSNKFILHEHFNAETAANDIALVKLPEDVQFTSRIRPAVLPLNYRRDSFTGDKVVATGWGAVGETQDSDPMQYTELRVISNEECAEEYDVVTKGVICAKGLQDETVCSGDSGGPLVLKGTQVVVGVTSFGPADGCETNIPGGFTRVTHYLDWIESKIGNLQQLMQQTSDNDAKMPVNHFNDGQYHHRLHHHNQGQYQPYQHSLQHQQQLHTNAQAKQLHVSADNENIV